MEVNIQGLSNPKLLQSVSYSVILFDNIDIQV